MKKITLGDLCEPSAGQLKIDKDTLVDYFDISSVDNASKTTTGFTTYSFGEAPSRARKAVKRNSILVSTVRPNLNAVALFDEETDNIPVASTGFCVLDCKKGVNPRFVFNFCRSKTFIDDMTSQATGASYPAVSDKIVRSAKIPDYSEEEQSEISETLDRVSEVIEMRKQELQKLDELIKARFVEMFSEYEWSTTVGNYIAELRGGKSLAGTEPCKNKVLKTGAATFGWFDPEQYKYLPQDYEPLPEHKVETGDVIISRMNTPELVGACSYVFEAPDNMYYPDRLWKVIPKNNANPIFIWQLLWNPEIRRQIKEKSGGTSGTMHNISKPKLLEIKCIDVPVTVQNDFADFVKQVDKSKVIENNAFGCLIYSLMPRLMAA